MSQLTQPSPGGDAAASAAAAAAAPVFSGPKVIYQGKMRRGRPSAEYLAARAAFQMAGKQHGFTVLQVAAPNAEAEAASDAARNALGALYGITERDLASIARKQREKDDPESTTTTTTSSSAKPKPKTKRGRPSKSKDKSEGKDKDKEATLAKLARLAAVPAAQDKDKDEDEDATSDEEEEEEAKTPRKRVAKKAKLTKPPEVQWQAQQAQQAGTKDKAASPKSTDSNTFAFASPKDDAESESESESESASKSGSASDSDEQEQEQEQEEAATPTAAETTETPAVDDYMDIVFPTFAAMHAKSPVEAMGALERLRVELTKTTFELPAPPKPANQLMKTMVHVVESERKRSFWRGLWEHVQTTKPALPPAGGELVVSVVALRDNPPKPYRFEDMSSPGDAETASVVWDGFRWTTKQFGESYDRGLQVQHTSASIVMDIIKAFDLQVDVGPRAVKFFQKMRGDDDEEEEETDQEGPGTATRASCLRRVESLVVFHDFRVSLATFVTPDMTMAIHLKLGPSGGAATDKIGEVPGVVRFVWNGDKTAAERTWERVGATITTPTKPVAPPTVPPTVPSTVPLTVPPTPSASILTLAALPAPAPMPASPGLAAKTVHDFNVSMASEMLKHLNTIMEVELPPSFVDAFLVVAQSRFSAEVPPWFVMAKTRTDPLVPSKTKVVVLRTVKPNETCVACHKVVSGDVAATNVAIQSDFASRRLRHVMHLGCAAFHAHFNVGNCVPSTQPSEECVQ